MNQVVLGTMNIGYPYSSNTNNSKEYYKEIIETYLKSADKNNAYLDTAYYYGNTQCETILGEILPELSFIPKIATKANPWFDNDFSNGQLGQLNTENIKRQLTTSLNNLKVDNIEIFFLHCPDNETPLEETLEICDTFWRKEKYNYLGISNFSFNQIIDVFNICEETGFNSPVFYQGMYNLISRKVEEIFPLIESYDMDFWAYNPLAGGLLTGKYLNDSAINSNSRFKDNKIYQNIFWKPEILDHLSSHYIKNPEQCLEDSFNWLQYFSRLRQNDKIIIGASTIEQLNTNINIIKTPVKFSITKIIMLNNIYTPIKDFSPDYYY